MLCNKCRRNHEDHAKTTSSICLVNCLLESTTPLEESLEKVERLAMLHKHARINYSRSLAYAVFSDAVFTCAQFKKNPKKFGIC